MYFDTQKRSGQRLGKNSVAAITLTLGLCLANNAIAENCGHVSAYWQTNMKSLVESISSCDASKWQSCSQAAAIHYDLIYGSLGQRAHSCNLQTSAVPGKDYTKPQSTDTRRCLHARGNLRSSGWR